MPDLNKYRWSWAEVALICLVAALSIYAHFSLGFVNPLPWPDEAHFLWPSISLAEHGSFITPVLNPDRPILWMPQGYMTLMGGLFAITGPSLPLARAISLTCVLLALVFFLKILKERGFSVLTWLVVGWFFLDAYFIGCGNVARMEAPLLLLVIVAFWLFLSGRRVLGIALLLFAPFLHPNGLYFLASGVLFTGVCWWRSKERPEIPKSAITIAAIALICWAAYAWYLFGYWEYLKQDLHFQFERKAERSVLGQIMTTDNLALLVMVVLTLLIETKTRRKRLGLLMLALPCWAIQVVGFEMWYKVFWMMAAVIVTVVFLQSILDLLDLQLQSVNKITRWVAISILIAVVMGWHLSRGNIESPVNYPYAMKFFEMSTPDGVPYLTSDDKGTVTSIIEHEAEQHPTAVQFFPRAEALLYEGLRSDRVSFSDPLFYQRRADLYIFHESRYLPPRWLRFLFNDMTEAGLNPQERMKYVAFERNDHERWYVYRPGQ